VIFGNASQDAEFEAQRANTNAFVWDMAVHMRIMGATGLVVRLLNVVAGTDPVWGWSGSVAPEAVASLGGILLGTADGQKTLSVHRAIARNITLLVRYDMKPADKFHMNKTEKRIAADARGIWRLATERLSVAMSSGGLALKQYNIAGVDVVAWFLEGLITSIFFADTGRARVLLSDPEWVGAISKLAQRVVDHVNPSRPVSTNQYDPAELVVASAILEGPPPPVIGSRLPQMRVPEAVTFATESRRTLGDGVLFAGDAAQHGRKVAFVSRPQTAGMW
jgi:hypothetical protein